MNKFAIVVISLALTGCGTFKPSDLLDIFKARVSAQSAAQLVVDCVRGTPAEARIADNFNYLLDLEQRWRDMEPDKEAVKQIIGGRVAIYRAGAKWQAIKQQLSTLDCDPRLADLAADVEGPYNQLVAALEANERLVSAFEWGEVLAGIFGGPAARQIVRLSAQAASDG